MSGGTDPTGQIPPKSLTGTGLSRLHGDWPLSAGQYEDDEDVWVDRVRVTNQLSQSDRDPPASLTSKWSPPASHSWRATLLNDVSCEELAATAAGQDARVHPAIIRLVRQRRAICCPPPSS